MNISVIPRTQAVSIDGSMFVLDTDVTVFASPDAAAAADWLRQRLREGARRRVTMASHSATTIRLDVNPSLGVERFRLRISARGISITGGDAAGLHYGVGTLLQLMPDTIWRRASAAPDRILLPHVDIDDGPTFTWRGLMLDVARHFQPVRELMRIIDLLALHRYNRLHLHLTDDQGWRVEIRRHPRLTQVGSWRRSSQVGADDATAPEDHRPHGGYYTQDEIRELVMYAEERGIIIVPEIDLPGHSQAAIAAYPALGIGTDVRVEVGARWGTSAFPLNAEESTLTFFRDVLDEIIDLFPSEFIGLGGDECPPEPWLEDQRSRDLASLRGLPSAADLPGWMLTQLQAHVTSRGRRTMAWDEALQHGQLDEDALILGWRGGFGVRESIRTGHEVIACPDDRLYFDYRQSEDPGEPIAVGVVVDLESVYTFNPIPDDVPAHAKGLILGAQANLWTEHLDSPRSLDYMLWPRACALAEVLWSGPGGDFDEFRARLARHLGRLTAIGVDFRDPDGPEPWRARPGVGTRLSTHEEREAEVRLLTQRSAGISVTRSHASPE